MSYHNAWFELSMLLSGLLLTYWAAGTVFKFRQHRHGRVVGLEPTGCEDMTADCLEKEIMGRTRRPSQWHRLVPSPSTARANGAGLPKTRKRGKLANDPAAYLVNVG